MKTNIKLIHVKYEGQKVGRLVYGNDFLCRFEYDTVWLQSGFSISPFHLPLKPGVYVAKSQPFNGLFGVFNDSMPDGWGNLLLDRFLQSKGINLAHLTPLDRLAFVGNSGMGALCYEPDNSLFFSTSTTNLSSIAKQVSEILYERADIPTVKQMLELTGSSGGARPKVLIKHLGATWMVKFPSSSDSESIGTQEYKYSQLAKQCGIIMPETKLFEGRFFGTKLFDRVEGQRFHVHSASGLLHASHQYPSLDYLQLAKATLALTKSMHELEKLLLQMAFNVVIGNKDDHAKNFSFIYRNRNWELSPAYDILKSEGFGGEHATAVAGNGSPTKADMINVAREVGFSVKKMEQMIGEINEKLKMKSEE